MYNHLDLNVLAQIRNFGFLQVHHKKTISLIKITTIYASYYFPEDSM